MGQIFLFCLFIFKSYYYIFLLLYSTERAGCSSGVLAKMGVHRERVYSRSTGEFAFCVKLQVEGQHCVQDVTLELFDL